MNRNKIVFSICAIIFAIVFFEIIIYINNGIKISELNNMYKDIKNLEDKIALYYLDNGKLPVKDLREIDFKNESVNPNDNDIYYEIDLSLLENMNLFFGYKKNGNDDIYIINQKSHTVYYLKGCKSNEEIIYTRELEYEYIDLEKY